MKETFPKKSFFPDQFKNSMTFPDLEKDTWLFPDSGNPEKSMLALLIVGYGKIKKKSISDFKISTRPASKTTSQDSRTFGISVLCYSY